ncbi:MAG TPA: sulfur transferase domain-containing protein [Candidatus Angelobacter sp.]
MMKRHFFMAVALALVLLIAMASAVAQQTSKEIVPGITNLARVENTVATSGAIMPEAVPEIKKMGFATIINLRESSEAGANIEAEEAAAKNSGLRYYHIPFNGAAPDPRAADRFLDVITAKGTEPAFIHCASGNRAATMWLIKRLVVDHWEIEGATREAETLGLTSQKLRQWAVDYAQAHER